LIQVLEGDTPYSDFLKEKGEGVQHLGFHTNDLKGLLAAFAKEGLEPCLNILKQLKSKRGTYAILGNTDYLFFDENSLIAALKQIGITTLTYNNLKLDFGKYGSFWLIGISYIYDRPDNIAFAFRGVSLDEPKIMLIHVPDVADEEILAEYKPQLILAGHTHGGQFGIDPIRRYSPYAERSRYMSGLFNINGMSLYVNRGIGMKTIYMRFMCRPEITVIKLGEAR